jgi:hypothetical protein
VQTRELQQLSTTWSAANMVLDALCVWYVGQDLLAVVHGLDTARRDDLVLAANEIAERSRILERLPFSLDGPPV